MKKLKNRLQTMRSTLSVKTHKTPRLFVIGVMLLINVLVLIVAAIIALIIDDTFNTFIEALALGSVTWLLSPNSIMVIENPHTLFLAVIVLIIGIVLFSGTIIALITNALKDYFERKQTSSGKIYLNQHIVILNWNNKIPELVADLLNVKSLASRRLSIIILSDINRHEAEEKIRSAMLQTGVKKETMKRLDCIIKHGNPMNQSELRDVSIEQSDTIIVMNKEPRSMQSQHLSEGDLNIIKILLTLGQLDIPQKTNIITEVKQFETKAKVLALRDTVSSLAHYTIIPICFDRRLGQIMAQTIINSMIEDVYLALFSFKGAQVHYVKNASIVDVLTTFSHAIPLKRSNSGVYVLTGARSMKALRHQQNLSASNALKLAPLQEQADRHIIIVGNNNKRQFIEHAFSAYQRLYDSHFTIEHVLNDDIESLAKRLNTFEASVHVLLLSDESAPTDQLDANVINNLLYLRQALKNDNVHIIVELLDPKNDALIKEFDIDNTIISNKIVSLLLGQVSMFPETELFYDDLLSIEPHEKGKDNAAIVIKDATEWLKTSLPLHSTRIAQFSLDVYEASNKLVVPIGFIRNKTINLFHGDLIQQSITIEPSDQIILYKV